MRTRKGNIWWVQGEADLFLFTANSTIRDGKLVMGAGFALEVNQAFPKLKSELPLYIKDKWKLFPQLKEKGLYGVVRSCYNNMGAFQTKVQPQFHSNLSIIEFSCKELVKEIELFNLRNVHLNFPGIGLGKLKREDVEPVLEKLPDCVTVWYL